MIFIDTNILIYAAVEQDLDKKAKSIELLERTISNRELTISTLVLQEYAFTLAKLNMNANDILKDINFYSQFAGSISKELFISAVNLCSELNYYKNINDVIHLKYAEKTCEKLVTFDSDFIKFKSYTALSLEI